MKTLEEHVARALYELAWSHDETTPKFEDLADIDQLQWMDRAEIAIAAVREREGAEACDVCGYALPIGGAKGPCPTHGSSPVPDPAEAMRAKCEAIARGEEVRNPSNNGTQAARRIKRKISALKGNGAGN